MHSRDIIATIENAMNTDNNKKFDWLDIISNNSIIQRSVKDIYPNDYDKK